MESSANYAWAFAVIGGTIMLGLVIALNTLRSRRKPKVARDADAPRSYAQPSDRTGERSSGG